MTHILLPAIWLIILLVGLPQLSETVYTPSLPDITQALQTSESMVEYTLTIYLFSFALGTLFWGKISDKVGRKPCVIWGLCIFIMGCIGCYFSDSITALMLSRFIQAFGGSIGSVIAQAICRDAFHGPKLGHIYSSIGSALAIFPAIGPVIGGYIAQSFGWESIFIFLAVFATILTFIVILRLPETHQAHTRVSVSMLAVMLRLMKDKKVICMGFIVGGCSGISFSYFAEGSFYLIKMLGLSPTTYGLTFIVMAASSMLGGMASKLLQKNYETSKIINFGILIITLSSVFSSSFILWHTHIQVLSTSFIIAITLIAQMGIMFGTCMTVSNALSWSLVDYKDAIGTASSLFGFSYYCLASLFTLGMGYLHNDTLLPMPLYFLLISLLMVIMKKSLVK